MKRKYLILILVSVFVFIGCDKEDEEFVPPSVVTVKSKTLDSGGVIIYGDFQNFSSEDELGFIVSNNSNSYLNPIITDPKVGQNSITITKGLYLDQEYRFIAYIKTKTEVYNGLEESFFSTGSKLISFSSMNPDIGNFYGEIEIETNDELEEDDNIRVLFNNKDAEIKKIEKNKIICLVPYFEGDYIADIKFEYFGKKIPSSLKFELLKPKIESVSKTEVAFEDEITIIGENFENGYDTNLEVFIDNIKATIINKTATEVTIKIPNEVIKKIPTIKVKSNHQEIVANNLLKLKDPVIKSYPTSAHIFDEITLLGENFNPNAGNNTVYFGDSEAIILSGDAGSLRVKVPAGVYTNWEPSIRVEVSEELKSIEHPFSILDAVIEINDNMEMNIIDFQVIDDVIYVYAIGAYTPSELEIYKYSVENNEFYDKKIVNLPSQVYPFIVKPKGEFMYLYFNRDNSDFYRVNLVSAIIERLADFPGDRRYMSQVAVHDGNVFLGGGSTNTTYDNIDYVDFYKYNVGVNTWEQLTDLVPDKFQPIYYNFYTDNLAYMLTGRASNPQEIYKFDGNMFNNLNTAITNPYIDFIGRRYFYKEGLFYIVEDNPAGYKINKFRVYNTIDNSWGEILDIFPKDYTIIGMFQHDIFVYFETIDYHGVRHLIKLDLNKL